MTLDGINSKQVILPTDTGDEKKTTELTEAEKAAEQLTIHFSDLSKSVATSMVKKFKDQEKANPTKEQADLDAETRETRAKAHAADVETIKAMKEAAETALKNHIVKTVITPKTGVYGGLTTFNFTTDLVNESQKPITDYAEQLTKNPELTPTKFEDGGTKYEDKDGHRAGYISEDGKTVIINNPDEYTASVSYIDTDGDGLADSETVHIK